MVPPPAPAIDSSSTTTTPSSQYTQQFLSTVLSQRGPTSLPYSEDVKWLIRQHLLSLSENYPSLQPKTSVFTHNDGRTINLLQSNGTLPMVFHDVTYNIPVVIWLLDSYPRHPPLVFVNPTTDMIIKRPHPFVNPSGVVSIPYLLNWVYPSSNLVDLSRNLSHFFGRDPPLYSQRRPIPNPNPNTSFGSVNNGSLLVSSNSSLMGSTQPAIPPRVYPPSPYGGGGGRILSSVGSTTEDPAEVFKRGAITKLVESLHGDITGFRKSREGEMEGLFSVQIGLKSREEQLSKGLREMLGEKEGLEQQLQMVLTNTDVLEGWLRDNEGKVAKMEGNVEVDDAFEPCDVLSKQIIECSASDMAIEDVIYSLDKAVQEGAIPIDQYLRNVRSLARGQFFHRATGSKVRAAQMQAQVASMAARLSQYGS